MKGFDLSKLRINPNNPYPFSGSNTEWADFKKKLDRDPEFMEANKIAFDSSRDNLIIAGNKRVQALRELGWKMIPDKYVIDCKDWSEEKRERYIYASNWNIGQWSMEFTSEEQAEEWGITFEEEEEVHLEAQEDDYVPPAEIQTDIVRGDLFELKKGDLCHRLLCGDSTSVDDVEKLMNGEKADMVFTDPPYGINEKGDRSNRGGLTKGNNLHDFIDDSSQYAIDAFNNPINTTIDSQVWFGANYYCHSIPETNNWLVWDKRVEEKQRDTQSDCELAWVKSRFNSVRIFRHLWKGLMKDSERGEKRVHPTQKPIALIAFAVKEYCPKALIILDYFLGSHSTMVAAHQLERNCYGIEIDEKYCQVGIDRMLKLDDKIQLFRNGKDVTEKYRKRLLASEKQA